MITNLKKFSRRITDRNFVGGLYPSYYNGKVWVQNMCFASLPLYVEQMQYTIYALSRIKSNTSYNSFSFIDNIDYPAIFKDIKNLFGGIFKINYRKTKPKSAYLIGAELRYNDIPWNLRYTAYLQLFVILRALDAENSTIWRANSTKVTSLSQMLKIYAQRKGIKSTGHCHNENLIKLSNTELLPALTDYYLGNLRLVFSGDLFLDSVFQTYFDSVIRWSKSSNWKLRITQSQTFLAIERAVREWNKKQ